MRCKLCDTPLLPHEVVWDEERGEHEEFCKVCQKVELQDDTTDYLESLGIDVGDSGIVDYD